jgi:hypothetical protein
VEDELDEEPDSFMYIPEVGHRGALLYRQQQPLSALPSTSGDTDEARFAATMPRRYGRLIVVTGSINVQSLSIHRCGIVFV